MQLTRPHLLGLCLATVFCSAVSAHAALDTVSPRRVVHLNGTWQVAQGSLDKVPQAFEHTVPVPGLMDMANPPFEQVGVKTSRRDAFWYRRTFRFEGDVPPVAILKIHKAKYGLQLLVNGSVVGERTACFTPVVFDVRKYLNGNGQENELVIRVGAHRELIPAGVPSGWDFEKYRYLPGIYDSVDLILTGSPSIRNIQTVPDLDASAVRVLTEVTGPPRTGSVIRLKAVVTEAVSGKEVAATTTATASRGDCTTIDVTLPVPDCRLWSPEDPFLYRVTVSTDADAASVRFGMRSFRFDPVTKRAMLNGKPYYMRGSNVCIYRFFEDAQRKDLPWRDDWVRTLHRRLKSMHWNSLRYCIGFPPERWYAIADEEGFLIQDEFPIWLLSKAPEAPRAEKIAPQYETWIRARWNHPCVVIWDAQNESRTDQTGLAMQAVRHLDLQNRPWENGWAAPQGLFDCAESHPYLFIRGWQGKETFRLKQMPSVSGSPRLNAEQQRRPVSVIINEYGWLWLNRDGTPTCLTNKIYPALLGPKSTTDQRRRLYARYLAALTEFWRCHRQAAGVLHFCGLGYSRSGDKPRPEGGATSDHWIDLERLTFEPYFAKYVRDAFNPVGLMLDFWAEELPAGEEHAFAVHVINDLDRPWQGEVRLRFVSGSGHSTTAVAKPCRVPPLGKRVVTLATTMPQQPGDYTVVAELQQAADGTPVRSLRDVTVK